MAPGFFFTKTSLFKWTLGTRQFVRDSTFATDYPRGKTNFNNRERELVFINFEQENKTKEKTHKTKRSIKQRKHITIYVVKTLLK